MTCPQCNIPPEINEVRFSEHFRCRHCGTELTVAPNYLRFFILLSFPLAFGVLWLLGTRGLLLYLLWYPVAILLCAQMVRAAVRFVPPTLLRRQFSDFVTTLNLAPPPQSRFGAVEKVSEKSGAKGR